MASHAWWLRLGREGASGGKINVPAWYAVMKNRYGWKDKVETSEGEKPLDQMSKEEVMAELISRKDGLAKVFKTSNVSLTSDIASGDTGFSKSN